MVPSTVRCCVKAQKFDISHTELRATFQLQSDRDALTISVDIECRHRKIDVSMGIVEFTQRCDAVPNFLDVEDVSVAQGDQFPQFPGRENSGIGFAKLDVTEPELPNVANSNA
jgi:hypothetical protein